jgi:hypothetical protein
MLHGYTLCGILTQLDQPRTRLDEPHQNSWGHLQESKLRISRRTMLRWYDVEGEERRRRGNLWAGKGVSG